MNNIHTCIENFINGNLSDAKSQAKRISKAKLFSCLVNSYGKTYDESWAIIDYLRHPSQATFQAACDAEAKR